MSNDPPLGGSRRSGELVVAFRIVRGNGVEVPEPEATAESGEVVSPARAGGKFFQFFRVAAADDDVIDDERAIQDRDELGQDIAPLFVTEFVEALAAEDFAED